MCRVDAAFLFHLFLVLWSFWKVFAVFFLFFFNKILGFPGPSSFLGIKNKTKRSLIASVRRVNPKVIKTHFKVLVRKPCSNGPPNHITSKLEINCTVMNLSGWVQQVRNPSYLKYLSFHSPCTKRTQPWISLMEQIRKFRTFISSNYSNEKLHILSQSHLLH